MRNKRYGPLHRLLGRVSGKAFFGLTENKPAAQAVFRCPSRLRISVNKVCFMTGSTIFNCDNAVKIFLLRDDSINESVN